MGIRELIRVNCPEIIQPDGTTLKPLGMVKLSMMFARSYEQVKFLVMDDLAAQEFILGADGQAKSKVRLDWEQRMVRFDVFPVTIDRSKSEAKMQRGS